MFSVTLCLNLIACREDGVLPPFHFQRQQPLVGQPVTQYEVRDYGIAAGPEVVYPGQFAVGAGAAQCFVRGILKFRVERQDFVVGIT